MDFSSQIGNNNHPPTDGRPIYKLTTIKLIMNGRLSKEDRARQMAEQLKRNDAQVINELLSDGQYAELRQHYKQNFEEIAQLIERDGYRISIESIFNIPNNVPRHILSDKFLFVMQLNQAISRGSLTEDMIP